MVYRRRTYRRTRRYGRKRTFRRRYRRSTRYSKRGQKLYLFKRFTGVQGAFILSNINPVYQGFQFRLQDLPNYTEFTNLYDMYKLNAVKITFLPQMTQNVSIGSVNNAWASARLFSAIDYNDANAPTSLDDLRQYQTCRYTPILRKHKRYIYKPKIVDQSGNYMPSNPWLNTTSPGVLHFGLKVGAEPMSSTTTMTMTYNIECKYYLSFKNVK